MDVLGGPVYRLLEEAYAASLDPTRYDQLMQCWGAYILQRGSAVSSQRESTERALEGHFDRALTILERLPGGEQHSAGLAALPVAAAIVDATGAILACNQRARSALFEDRKPTWENLRIDGAERAQLMAALRSGAANVVCQLGPRCAIARRLERSALRQLGVTTRTRGAFLLTALELRIEPHILRAFGAAYGLTPTEAEVAMALARGSNPSAIAEERGVSLNTVRTQIKVVLRKLDVQAISDVIRLLSAFAAGYPSSQPQPEELSAQGVRKRGRLTLPDGRALAFEQSGDPHGRPVLFLHNMLHGVSLSKPAIAAARSRGWRLIAPSRPGFGRSDALSGVRGLELVDAVAHDCRCLLDHLQIPRALVLGHLSGGIYATRFAERMPERTHGLLLASYLPTWEDSRMLTMSSLARWMALAARHTPRLLPFIAHAGCAHVLAGCESQLLTKLHGEIAADMEALSIPEVRCVVDEGLRHTSIQGGTAFCNDCPLVLTDWIELARRVSRPARLFIGSDDMFARPDAVHAFVQRVPHFSLTMLQNAGAYALYTHWPALLDNLEQLYTQC